MSSRTLFLEHVLPPTCFGACYTILRDTIALFAQELYAFCNVATWVVFSNVKELMSGF